MCVCVCVNESPGFRHLGQVPHIIFSSWHALMAISHSPGHSLDLAVVVTTAVVVVGASVVTIFAPIVSASECGVCLCVCVCVCVRVCLCVCERERERVSAWVGKWAGADDVTTAVVVVGAREVTRFAPIVSKSECVRE